MHLVLSSIRDSNEINKLVTIRVLARNLGKPDSIYRHLENVFKCLRTMFTFTHISGHVKYAILNLLFSNKGWPAGYEEMGTNYSKLRSKNN